MKLCKHYSLDECVDKDLVFDKLDSLQSDTRIEYTIYDEVIKIKDIGLTVKERKELITFFSENDVIDYPDYENLYDYDNEDEEDDEEDEEDEYDY